MHLSEAELAIAYVNFVGSFVFDCLADWERPTFDKLPICFLRQASRPQPLDCIFRHVSVGMFNNSEAGFLC